MVDGSYFPVMGFFTQRQHHLLGATVDSCIKSGISTMNTGVFVTVLSGAGVEFFETAAIAYAVARSGYAREAIWGTVSGVGIVAVSAALVGTGLKLIPLHLLQIAIGLVLLWFGWGWYKKSILRQASHRRAGWITDPLEAEGIHLESRNRRFSHVNFIVMFKSAALETLEVALVVLPLGLASGAWAEALSATGIALLFTLLLVAVLHGYLVKVPEVLLKLGAGILLLSYGTFWLGEGLGFDWWLGDWMLLILFGIYSLVSVLAIRWIEAKQAASRDASVSIVSPRESRR